ncbi:MAG: hypothetical protein AAB649_04210, partial [Patescibacteria group bacterium]
MKVELEKLRLAVTAVGKRVVIGIPDGAQAMKHKHDVTSDFNKALVDYGLNLRRSISGDGKNYEMAVTEDKDGLKQLYSRKEVIKKLTQAVS